MSTCGQCHSYNIKKPSVQAEDQIPTFKQPTLLMTMRVLVFSFVLLTSCASLSNVGSSGSEAMSKETRIVRDIFDDYHRHTLSLEPSEGPAKVSAEHQLAQLPQLRSFLDRISSASLRNLTHTDSLSALVLSHDLRDQIHYLENEYFVLPLTGWFDYHTTFASLTPGRDTLAYLNRLADFPRLNDEYIDLMRRGIRSGLVRPKEVFTEYLPTIEAHVGPGGEPASRANQKRCLSGDLVSSAHSPEGDLRNR